MLDLVEEVLTGSTKDRVFLMKLSAILLNQTFVAIPTSLTVADYAAFFIASQSFVLSLVLL